MKVCLNCKQTKPFTEMVKDTRKPDGLGSLCKVCRNARQKIQRDSKEKSTEQRLAKKPTQIIASTKLTASQRHAIGAGQYVKREREANEATGQLINKMAGKYTEKDSTFYRNDGHKHIKSLGVLC